MGPLGKLGFMGWAVIAAAGAIASVLVVGTLYQPQRTADDRADEARTAAPAPTPEAVHEAVSEPVPEAAPSEPEPVPEAAAPPRDAVSAVTPPGFDVVRIARDGAALVAGTAQPGAGVTLRVDGEEVAQTAADRGGEFVAMFALPPAPSVQMMTLEMLLADGRVVHAEDSVVLTPRPMPDDEEAPAPLALAEAAIAPPPADAAVDTGPPDLVAEPEPGLAGQPPATALPPLALPESPQAPAQTPETPEPIAEAPSTPMPDAVSAPPLPATAADPAADPASDMPAELALPGAPLVTGDDAPRIAALPAPDGAAAHAALPLAAREPPAGAEDTPRIDTPVQPEPPVAASLDASDSSAPAPAPPGHDALAVASPAAPTVDPAVPQAAQEPLPRAFLLRPTGEVALLDRAPQVMDNVVIDMIAYDAEGDVQISGRAARADPEGRLQLYLDNRPIGTARAEAGDWRLDLPDIDPGVYTLRIDQLGAEGQVISRFETPFQREAPELVARARAEAGAAAPLRAQVTLEQAQEGTPVDGVEEDDPPEPKLPRAERPEVALITVQPGHSLWRISSEHYGEGLRWVQIYRANRGQIRNPDLIYPGQIFTLPD